MRKLLVVFLVFVLGSSASLKADEGMWLPMLIEKNIVEMHEMGLKLSPKDIYNVNQASLKDAIVIFGRGCTGELISPEGLLLTNHHCGYGSIQKLSTDAHNYLDDGFWAMSKEEELPVKGLTVRSLVEMKDVTKLMMGGTSEVKTEADRQARIQGNIDKKMADLKKKGIHAVIESFFGANEYYMFIYEVYNDVRLVGAPPESIGKYGADTDNWMWPRHTGDFSMFRVYTGPDGKPAAYSEENIPMKPKHFLPISIAGVEKDDFSMIMGYPGSTDRYLSSYGVDLAVRESNMTIVKIREEKLRIMKEGMDADESVRLKYASKYARTANYWKYFIGQTKGLKRLKVKEKKQAEEEAFRKWLKPNKPARDKYGTALTHIENAYEVLGAYNLAKWYNREAVLRGSEILGYAGRFTRLMDSLNEKNTKDASIDAMVAKLQKGVDAHFKDYNQSIDRNLLASMLAMFHEAVPLDQQPAFLLELANKNNGDFNEYADMVFDKSIFRDAASINAFLENPSAKKISKDHAFKAYTAFIKKYKSLNANTKDATAELKLGNRLYIAGLRDMNKDKNYYPDANFTMRLTYGTTQDYYPSDAVHYNYYTTMKGIMQKEDPNNWEFQVPAKLKELYEAKDFGPYGEDGVMKVCFLTNHDITGGNSGSPVINGHGELVGLAFDGNWEAMSGDIAFEPNIQRTINVDIRYVLFIVDKFAGATNLIDEMTIVTEKHKDKPAVEKKEVSTEIEVEVEQ